MIKRTEIEVRVATSEPPDKEILEAIADALDLGVDDVRGLLDGEDEPHS